MARTSRTKTLTSLEGRLGLIRREVQKVMRGLQREIARREGELAALKAEYGRGADLLRGGAKTKGAVAVGKRKRARQINWKGVFATLPPRFSLGTLGSHPVAGKRSKAHLYTIVSRWKKMGMLTPDPAGGYRKTGAQQRHKPKRSARPKAIRVPKPTPRPEAPTA
jgi:hypothetical protein